MTGARGSNRRTRLGARDEPGLQPNDLNAAAPRRATTRGYRMAPLMARGDSAPGGLVLRGRRDECAVLDGLLEDARAGQQRGAGLARGRGDRKDGAARVRDRVGVGYAGAARGWSGVGDGACVRGAASVVRTAARPSGRPSRSPARCAGDNVRIERGRGAGPLLRRTGSAWSVVRGGAGAPASVRDR